MYLTPARRLTQSSLHHQAQDHGQIQLSQKKRPIITALRGKPRQLKQPPHVSAGRGAGIPPHSGRGRGCHACDIPHTPDREEGSVPKARTSGPKDPRAQAGAPGQQAPISAELVATRITSTSAQPRLETLRVPRDHQPCW